MAAALAEKTQMTFQIRSVVESLLRYGALVTLLVAFLPANAGAQQNDDVVMLGERVEEFFDAFTDRMGIRAAVEQLVAGGPLEQPKDDLVKQVEQFPTRYGRFIEAEQVAARTVGEDVVLLTYLYKTEQFPLVWRFVFYRAPETSDDRTPAAPDTPLWRAVSISFDTNYTLLELTLGANPTIAAP